MASWTGTTPFATKKQLVSSISGLYTDLQDLSGFEFQNILVSTATASQYISTPILFVSSIVGATIDISGGFVTESVSAGTGSFGLTIVSTFQFNVTNQLNPEFNISFDLGFGAMVGGIGGGLLAGFGAIVGGVFSFAGSVIGGAETGLATLINPRPANFINTSVFETINGSTQLQFSTLGQENPPIVAYSSIFRSVSSISPDQVPGREIFISTLFFPGQFCARSVSDPHNIITGDANIATSTIQSFGQWVPLQGVEPENIVASSIHIIASAPALPFRITNAGENVNNDPVITLETTLEPTFTQSYNSNVNPLTIAFSQCNVSYNQFTDFNNVLNFLSTPYTPPFTSTITNDVGINFIPSGVPNFAEITYDPPPGSFLGDFAICDPGEINFRSTGTFDFITTGTDMLIQWGLGAGRQAPIASTAAIRLDFDNVANTSNLAPIPTPTPIVVANSRTNYSLLSKPNEYQISIRDGTAPLFSPLPLAFDINSATFGSQTTFSNQPNYPYQFNGNLFVNGTIEADTLIALSSIFSVSTFVDTNFSTQSFEANTATILEGFISSLTANSIQATSLSSLTLATSNIFTTNLSTTQLSASNGTMTNLTVNNLVASNLIYSKAEAPTIETSTITFGWTGSFSPPVIPSYSLNQTLVTETGLVYLNFSSASNQVLNLMNFSNTVFVQAQQFSTALTDSSTEFSGLNIQGWASTIFFNNGPVGKQAILYQGSPPGELSFQGQTNQVQAVMNYVPNQPLPGSVTIPAGQTFKFTSDGSIWTTGCNAPLPGILTYNNNLNLSMDFENTNLTTTDTFNINAEQINLNGVVNIQYPFFSNIYVETFVSTSQLVMDRSYTGTYNGQGFTSPINISNTVNSTDFTNIKTAINPVRGFNAFNSVNFNEWNNTVYNIDINPASGLPTLILGDLIIKSPTFTPYAGQFFINNTIDSPSSNIPLYVNVLGLLSSIGVARSNQFTRVFTSNGSQWSFQSNVANPQGLGGYTYPNFYTMNMTSLQTVVQVGQPLIELTPSRTMTTNKLILDSPAIRVNTIASPSFPSKESGFELSSYFDPSVVFTNTQSDAVNPMPNAGLNYFFSVAGWSAQVWFGRIRTKSTGIQGFEISAVVQLITGTPGDFIWAAERYLNVVSELGTPEASIREVYFMTPKNYHTGFGFLGQQ